MFVINEFTTERLVDYFREIEETEIDEERLDAYTRWFTKEYDEFEDFDEALDEFCNGMWISVLPEVFN